jgi:hypothetical protein
VFGIFFGANCLLNPQIACADGAVLRFQAGCDGFSLGVATFLPVMGKSPIYLNDENADGAASHLI